MCHTNKKITYSGQHTGNGKYHLIPDDERFGEKELCNTKGTLLFTLGCEIVLEDGIFYEVYDFGKTAIPSYAIDAEYCKKCITKALKQYAELS